MGNLLLRIIVWTKVTLFALVTLYAVIFVAKNSERPVQPWFWFGKEPHTSVLVLVLVTFLLGVICTILFRTTLRTLRQIRDLRQQNREGRLAREVSDMRSKASMLRTSPLNSTEPVDQNVTPAE